MLGRVTVTTSEAAGAAPNIGTGANQLDGILELSFFIEEDEMLVDLEFRGLVTNGSAALSNATFVVTTDGVTTNLGGGTGEGLWQTPASAGPHMIYMRTTQRLARGQHTVAVWFEQAADITVDGDVIPAELVARRHSHPATLGHGVDSKAQLIQ